LLSGISLEGEMTTAEKNPILRRKSMELLKDLTQILREIIGSGDEESFRRLEETIRALDESRRKPGRMLHWIYFPFARRFFGFGYATIRFDCC